MHSDGFTFLELIITLAVAAILLLVGIPGLQYLLAESALQTEGISFHNALHRARSQAIDHQSDVIVCLADKQEQCVKQGFTHLLLFVDQDQDRKLSASQNGDTILFRHALPGTALTVTTNQLHFVFQPDGTQAGTPGTISLCGSGLSEGIGITIAMSGRVRQQKISCS